VIYKSADLTNKDLDHWRSLAISAGLKGIFFLGIIKNIKEGLLISQNGFDAVPYPELMGEVSRIVRLRKYC